MYTILQLNEISAIANQAFSENYTLTKECAHPQGIMLRSFKMHEYPLNKELLAVARCGAGTNNIPIEKCSQAGIVVFNTPGANANAVKELVLCNLFLASRKIIPAITWTQSLKGKGADVASAVEKGKGAFVGPEILGKKLGVIGLGAIGAQVANAAESLGMDVYGYDPYISVQGAWGLSRKIIRITDINTIFQECDYITIHVPYLPATKYTVNKDTISRMKDGVCIINCARGELVNNADIIEATRSGKVARYVTDFPVDELIGEENIICVPHLGASTPEAEDNCALAAARELVDYIENGNITNSVNFPDCSMPRDTESRICIVHLNIKDMICRFTAMVSAMNINIAHFVNKSQGDYAYSMLDLDGMATEALLKEISAIDGIISVRVVK